jgi:hypothetical protein
MNQNLEGKSQQDSRELKATRVSPKKVGVYLKGGSSRRTFVGHIENGMTDDEAQEYIEIQRRLAPPSLRDRESQSLNPVDDTNNDAKSSTGEETKSDAGSSAGGETNTNAETSTGEDTNNNAEDPAARVIRFLDTIYEEEDEEGEEGDEEET